MSIQILIDMNLSPDWVTELTSRGWASKHWSTVGSAGAHDAEIMQWARDNDHVVFTHDLDFGATLALTHAFGPSVIQVRGHKVLPEDIAELVAKVLTTHERELVAGALIVVDQAKLRVRILPF